MSPMRLSANAQYTTATINCACIQMKTNAVRGLFLYLLTEKIIRPINPFPNVYNLRIVGESANRT